MDDQSASQTNHLFALHIWNEKLEDGKTEWRGRITSLKTKRSTYFRTPSGLITQLQQHLDKATQEEK